MNSPSPISPPARGQHARQGFALLITITLVAFLVLVLVGLASFTRVETQVAANSTQLSQARQNALFALNIAVGELQKYAGPDQRVTANADIIAAAPNTGGGTTKWVGVWGNTADPQRGISSTPAVLQWLVSGNEKTEFIPADDVSSDPATFGRINQVPAAADFLPNGNVGGLSASTVASSTVTVNNEAAVLLIGPNTADFSNDATARLNGVVAPLVNIRVAESSVPGMGGGSDVTVGRYAWWVGDEGVKVRANVVDPYVTVTPAQEANSIPSAPASLNRLAVAQRHQIDAISGLAGIPANDENLRRLLSENQLPFAPGAPTPDVVRARFHDISLHSQGVLADSLRGGLRRDLTWAFADETIAPNRTLETFRAAMGLPGGAAVTMASANPIIDEENPANQPGTTPGAMLKAHRGPTWEQVRSFARIDANGTLAPQPQTALQHGVHPILVHAKIFFGGDTDPSATPEQEQFKLYVFPGFVLANPSNVTIAAATYQITISFDNMSATPGPIIGVYDGPGGGPPQFTTPWSGISLTSLLGNAKFNLDCPELAPGESAAFTLRDVHGNGEQPWVSAGTYEMENEWPRVTSTSANTYYTAIRRSTTGIIPRTEVQAEGRGITLNVPGMADNQGIIFRLLTPDGTVTQRISNLRSTRADGGWPGNSAYVIKTHNPNTAGAYNMDEFNPRRVQSGWTYKLVDLAAGRSQALGYNDAAFDNLRLPFWSQIDPFAVGQRRGAKAQGGNSTPEKVLGSDTWTSLSKSSRDGFSDFYVVAPSSENPIQKPHWAGGVADKTSNLGNYPLSRANWRPFAYPKPLAPGAGGLASLIDLRHMNASGYNQGDNAPPITFSHFRPSQPIGASRAQPYIARERVHRELEGAHFYDTSYLLNRKLLDGYFFSTYPQAGAPASYERLVNSRLIPSGPEVDLSDTAAFRGGTVYATGDERRAAARLLVHGAFNINSTSVEAWRAFLGSLAGTEFNAASGLVVPVVRSLYQVAGIATPADVDDDAAWNGFRNLTDAQLDALATAIVQQVRLRGPALSLADFVNRRLIAANTDTNGIGIAGALQKALDNTNINTGFPSTTYTLEGNKSTEPSAHPTTGFYADDDHLSPSQFEGTAAWVSQADILAPLLPVMSARSDTFRVRTYGETRNPVTNERTGHAWCEAIVQRQPDYVAGTEATLSPVDAAAASDLNRDFGRRFKVISFRWLSPNDI